MHCNSTAFNLRLPISITIISKEGGYVDHLKQHLAAKHILVRDDAVLKLILDIPVGWALAAMGDLHDTCCIIATENACAEYLMDVRDAGSVAVTKLFPLSRLARVVRVCSVGHQHFPHVETTLSPGEREIVRLIALGMTSKQIAGHRNIKHGTVRNVLGRIHLKLGVKSSSEIVKYYFGLPYQKKRAESAQSYACKF